MEKVGVELQVEKRRQFSRDMDLAAQSVRGVGHAADRTGRDFGQMERRVDRSRGAFRSFRRIGVNAVQAVGTAAAVAVAGGVHQLIAGFQDLGEQQRIAAGIDAGIESTGNAANVSAKKLANYADKVERTVGIEAEAVQTAQSMLLTFTKVQNGVGKGNKIFDQATKAITDMSVRMDGDMQGASIQVGKALNDPIKGVTALTKVGVQFTDQQKDQIKGFVESGKTMKAQKIILRELNTQFGGSAKEYGKTTGAMAAKAGHAWGNLRESVAGALEPAVREWLPKATKAMRDFAPKAAAWVRDDLVPAIKSFGDWWNDNSDTIKTTGKAIFEVIKAAVKGIGKAVEAVTGAVNAGIDLALRYGPTMVGVMRGALNGVLTMAEGTFGVLSMLPGETGRKFGLMKDHVKTFRIGANNELDRVDKTLRIAADTRAADQALDAMLTRLESITAAHSWVAEMDVRAGNAAAQGGGGGGRRGGQGGGRRGTVRASQMRALQRRGGGSVSVPINFSVYADDPEAMAAKLRKIAPRVAQLVNAEVAAVSRRA